MAFKLKKNSCNVNQNTERGNCLAQCLSFITKLPIENIPKFENLPAGVWKKELPKWLYSINLRLSKRYSARDEKTICIGVGVYLNVGINERHAMVFQGSIPIFDPNKPEDHTGPIIGMDMEYYLYLDPISK